MAKVTQHPHGSFCWPELTSNNWQAAKPFYCELLNWGFDDQPIGDDMYYTMLQVAGDDVAAMYQMEASLVEKNVPSHWLSYISVSDVDALVPKITELGGQVLHGPHEVGDAGRMVMLADPTGATCALWQGKSHPGAKRIQEPGTLYWTELATRDIQASESFYTALLGWSIQKQDMGEFEYTLFTVNDQPVAGMLQMTEEWPESVPPHWMVYFAVEDCEAKAKQATLLGGEICVPPTQVPNVGTFSVLTDPSGAVFSIIKGTEMES